VEKPTIYLAGCKGPWRDELYRRWHTKGLAHVLDPFTDSRQNAIADFTTDDLLAIKRATLILAFHGYHVFDGLAVECGYAYALDKPIIYVCEEPRASSMICGLAKAVFTQLEAALTFIEERYLYAQILITRAKEQAEGARQCKAS
jgi:nucleoside 2-deoxyribosyltransferase